MNIIIVLMIAFMSYSADGRIQIRQAGSSSVYPFAIKVAQELSKKSSFVCPLVESTSTGRGFADLIQSYQGFEYDVISASREINPKELEACKKNGISSILELCVGFDGITIAAQKNLTGFDSLSLKDIFLAIAQKVKNAKGDFIENPYKTWNEINAKLPNLPIRVLIPSKAHGTRDAFEKMVMHEEKVRIGPEVREITDYEAAEGHQLLFDYLENNKNVMGFVATNLLDAHVHIKPLKIDNVEPTYSNIQNGTYPMVRKLFIYVREDTKTEGILDYVNEWLSPAAISKDGYLTKMGLVPLLENTQRYRKL